MRYVVLIFTSVVLLLTNVKCSKTEPVADGTRSFYMGTTPWPADFTFSEVDTAYRFINDHCDIVSHHFDDGIPYDEAFNNTPMPPNFVQDVQTRLTKTAAGKKIMLSIAALAGFRIVKADYYNNALTPNNIKDYWRQLPVNNSKVITAYVNYVSWLVDRFHPIYVNFGVESNSSGWDPAQFILYKSFIAQVYPQLKLKYPNIPFYISFIVDETNEGFNYASQLIGYTDLIGLSAYPYVTVSSSANGNTDPANFPTNYFDKFSNLSTSKGLIFAETGYIAEDLHIPSYNLNKLGTAAWQKAYLELLLKFCNDKRAKIFIWFCSKDYDAGNNTLRNLGLFQDYFMLWQDTGLKDESGKERPAYSSWINWMKRLRVE